MRPAQRLGRWDLLVVASVLFGLWLLAPLLEPGYNDAGDDPVHEAYVHELVEIARSGGRGWSYLYGVGEPIFVFRPPGLYLTAALPSLLSFGLLDPHTAYKAVVVLGFCLYPLAVFFLMHRLGFERRACAIAAALSLTAISPWGHTLRAYFVFGLSKQVLAILAWPVALGQAWSALARGGSWRWAAALAAFVFLNHPYMGFGLFLLIGVQALAFGLAQGARVLLSALPRGLGFAALFACLSAPYLLPLFDSREILREEGYGEGLRSEFDFTASTASDTLATYLRGGLLDNTGAKPFGRERSPDYQWEDNAASGRLPVVSWASLLGLALLAARPRAVGGVVLLGSFLFSFLLFLGADDVSLLRLLPFQSEFQYLHAVFQLELFAFCLAGVGLSGLLQALSRLLPGRPARGGWLLIVDLLVLVPLLGSAWGERAALAPRLVDVRDFDTRRGEQTARSQSQAVNAAFQEVVDALRRDREPGRFYAGPLGEADHTEVFYFSVAPFLAGRTDLINGFFSYNLGGANRLLGENYRERLRASASLLELANVRHLLAHRLNAPSFEPLGARRIPLVENQYWSLSRLESEPGYYLAAERRPILAIGADRRIWLEVNDAWLGALAEQASPAELPFLVRAADAAGARQALDPERYPFVLLLDSGTAAELRPSLAEQAGRGVRLLSPLELPGLPVERVASLREALDRAGTGPRTVARLRERVAARERHVVEVSVSQEVLLVFKMAYYRGWSARVDGVPVPTLCASPGLLALHVPAGEHQVEFSYSGHNRMGLGAALCLAGAAVLGAPLVLRRGPRAIRSRLRGLTGVSLLREGASAPALHRGRLCLLPAALALYLGVLLLREDVLRIPVPIEPDGAVETPGELILDWNPLPQAGAGYELVVEDVQGRVVHEARGLSATRFRKSPGLPPGSYRWRVRSVLGGRPGPWSPRRDFLVKEPPLREFTQYRW